MMRKIATEAKLLLIGIPVLIWTLLPVYNLFLFSISPKESAFAGNLWPDHPTLHNFEVVFREQHYYLSHFWLQLWNSLLIGVGYAGALMDNSASPSAVAVKVVFVLLACEGLGFAAWRGTVIRRGNRHRHRSKRKIDVQPGTAQ